MKHSKFPYIVLTPLLLLLIVFTALPILGSIGISFLDYNPLRETGNRFIGLENYFRIFRDELAGYAFKGTLYFVLVSTVANLCITLLIAQLLASLESNRWRTLFRVAFFLPCVAPSSAVASIWMRSLLPVKTGLINMTLGALGMAKINWLDAGHLMGSIIVISLWADIGYNIILFVSGIEGIPSTYREAAEIDGAGPIRRFFRITLPLMNRTFVFVSITTIISYFQAFTHFMILAGGTGGPNHVAMVMSTYIYEIGFSQKNMGYASALSVVLFLVILAVTLVQRRLTRADWGY